MIDFILVFDQNVRRPSTIPRYDWMKIISIVVHDGKKDLKNFKESLQNYD